MSTSRQAAPGIDKNFLYAPSLEDFDGTFSLDGTGIGIDVTGIVGTVEVIHIYANPQGINADFFDHGAEWLPGDEKVIFRLVSRVLSTSSQGDKLSVYPKRCTTSLARAISFAGRIPTMMIAMTSVIPAAVVRSDGGGVSVDLAVASTV